MNKIATLRIAALSLIAAVLLISTGQITQTFAEENKKESDSVNDISLVAVFYFREATETVNTFKVFDTQSSGYDRTKALTFRLEGVISGDRPILYRAIDQTYQHGKNQNHEFSEFDVEVIFHNEPSIYRKFTYSDCQVRNYNVFTEFDKEETYQGKTKFAYIDKVELECRGFNLENPPYEKMMQDKEEKQTAEYLKSLQKVKGKKEL